MRSTCRPCQPKHAHCNAKVFLPVYCSLPDGRSTARAGTKHMAMETIVGRARHPCLGPPCPLGPPCWHRFLHAVEVTAGRTERGRGKVFEWCGSGSERLPRTPTTPCMQYTSINLGEGERGERGGRREGTTLGRSCSISGQQPTK